MARTTKHKARPQLERLEDRTVLTCPYPSTGTFPIDVSVQGGNLVIDGDNGDNRVRVRDEVYGGQRTLRVTHTYLSTSITGVCNVPYSAVTGDYLVFRGHSGQDHLDYTGVPWQSYLNVFADGGPGVDNFLSWIGDDILIGGPDRDTLDGHRGNDTILGGSGDDLLRGAWDDDFLVGGTGADRLEGGPGNDILCAAFHNFAWDGQQDWLFGGPDADAFLVDPPNEAADLNWLQGDTLIGEAPYWLTWLQDLGRVLPEVIPPALDAWVGEREALADPIWHLTIPHLGTEYEVVAPSTGLPGHPDAAPFTYNCFAWALGITDHWVQPDHPSPEEFDDLFRAHGFTLTDLDPAAGLPVLPGMDMVVLYGVYDESFPGGLRITHAARQMVDGTWTSKLAEGPLIRHPTLQSIAGGIYGEPLFVYTRPRL